MNFKWFLCSLFCVLICNLYGKSLSEINDYPTYRILPQVDHVTFSDTRQNIVFITFGGPSEEYHNHVVRICNQAIGLNFFTHILGFTEIDLFRDEDFWSKHGEFIKTRSRGYGYWLWKPYLINLVLEKLNENDILVYLDAGCKINPEGKPRLLEYIAMLNNSDYGVVSFQTPWWLEKYWTKKLLLDYMNMNNNEALNTGQCLGGIQVMKKNTHSLKITRKWYRIASIYELIDDSNISKNENEGFQEHRHDQSIYSLLVKKYGSIKVQDNLYFKGDNTRKLPFWTKHIN
jgi:hypothetical protein